ncbi:MAG: DNA polymerase III subunit beta [Candidatus Saganbacteria bacterium]|nr:DNA polymerase III subunit beta [Candidatus Saganbacteria bacterium]
MEFTCLRDDLQKGVQIVERIVSTRSTLPIIGNILFEANKKGLKLSANNLEVGIELQIEANIAKEGAVLVPAKTLASIVSKLPTGEVLFKLKDRGIINLSYKKSNFNLHSLPADEFPHLPKVKEDMAVKIEAPILSKMISQTIFSSSTTDDKYVLNGVLFTSSKKEKNILRLVATDGYRLACRSQELDEVAGEILAIVPNRALSELNRTLQQSSSGNVNVIFGRDQISFRYNDFYLVSRLIQGKFPDYHQVIPKKSETKIKVKSKLLLSSCERAQVIAASAANIVRLEIKENELRIIASAPDVGNIEEVLEVEIKGPEKKAVAFNVRLIIDALRAIEADEVMIELGSALSPGIIRPLNVSDYIYIVMPIRTQEAVSL